MHTRPIINLKPKHVLIFFCNMYMLNKGNHVSDDMICYVSMKETEIDFKVDIKLSLTRTKQLPMEIRNTMNKKSSN